MVSALGQKGEDTLNKMPRYLHKFNYSTGIKLIKDRKQKT